MCKACVWFCLAQRPHLQKPFPQLVLFAMVLLQGSRQKLGEQGIFSVVICSKGKDIAPSGIPVSLLNLEYRTFCLMRES